MVLPLGDSQRTRIVPYATYGLIALNLIVFALELRNGETFTTSYSATPYEIRHNVDLRTPPSPSDPRPEAEMVEDQGPVPFPVRFTILTAMFLHASPIHLVGNMLYLWIFGDNVEEVLGRFRYILVYLGCGLVAALVQIAADPESLIPTMGASGAIAGIMGIYLAWFPYSRVRVLVVRVVFEVPAVVVILLWIVLQIAFEVGSLGTQAEAGRVAYLEHLGGVAAGLVVAFLFRKKARALGQPTLFDRVVG